MRLLLGLGALAIGAFLVSIFLAARKQVGCDMNVCLPSPLFPFWTSGHVFYGLGALAVLLLAGLLGASITWIIGLALGITGGIFYDLWYHKYAH